MRPSDHRCAESVPPEVLEPVRRQLGIAHRVLNVTMTKVPLQRPRVMAGICQGESATLEAGVSQADAPCARHPRRVRGVRDEPAARASASRRPRPRSVYKGRPASIDGAQVRAMNARGLGASGRRPSRSGGHRSIACWRPDDRRAAGRRASGLPTRRTAGPLSKQVQPPRSRTLATGFDPTPTWGLKRSCSAATCRFAERIDLTAP